MSSDKIIKLLQVIRIACDKIEQELVGEKDTIKDILVEEVASPKEEKFDSDIVLFNDKWPEAVPSFLISEDEAGFRKRAKSILDTTDLKSLTGYNFLDFGCGDGYVVKAAAERGAKIAIGYDIEPKLKWKELRDTKVKFLDSYEEILNSGLKFDIILLYDVLDHTEEQEDVISKVKTLLHPQGTIYVRCHPYTSRHAAHIHKKLNKAFEQLFIEDLSEYDGLKLFKTTNPIETYHTWFEGLKIVNERITRTAVHGFFHRPDIKAHLAKQGVDDETMQIEFVDYILRNES